MKAFILHLIAIACFLPGLSQTKSDWKNQSLKGKVKSVTIQQTYRYMKNGVFTPWEKQYTTIYQFNPAGRYSSFQELLANGTQNYRVKYTYDLKAKKGEQAFFNKGDTATIRKLMTFDDKGNLTELSFYTNDGKPDGIYQYINDTKGNNTELRYYKPDGTAGSKTIYLYDEKNNLTDVTVETPGYANSYKKYGYDDKGNNTEESWFDGRKQLTFRFVRTYDDKGNKIEEVKYKDGKQRDRVTWKYEYDKQGNWIKKTQLTNEGTDFNIEERVISYY